MTHTSEQSCRILVISRIDFPSDGFRVGLMNLAASVGRQEDARIVVLAGGLVDGRYVKAKAKKLKKLISALTKRIKELSKVETAEELKKNAALIKSMQAKIERYGAYAEELSPEKMADQLAKLLPVFKNAKDETVKVYIFTSPAYDGEIGESVAQLLAERRPDDVRVYQNGGDRLYIKQAGMDVDVLVPLKGVWMRGDYFSTPIERVIKDKIRQTSRTLPDLYIVGCFGSTITKPKGEAKRPWVSAMTLCRLGEVRVNENQIGVRVVELTKGHTDPVTRNYCFKDYVQNERAYVPRPAKCSPKRQRILDAINERGRMSAGLIADLTDLQRSTVEGELAAMVNRDGKRPKSWPGLRLFEEAKQVDYDGYWVRENLKYPDVPTDRKVDSIVSFGCLHSGSIYSDYRFFQNELPRVILAKDAQVLIGAGDLAEGYVYRDELYAGMNLTEQETFAGELLARVMIDVFKVRFEKALLDLGKEKANPEQIIKLAERSLITLVVIPGNHDLWSLKTGTTPLVVLKKTVIDRVCETVSGMLAEKGHCVQCLAKIVRDKVVEPDEGEYTLPSGLKATIMHPHMSRAQTTSIRPQQMLDFAPDSHVVIGANFHVAEHLEMWGGDLGQRVCMELGTNKRRSEFETHKLKIVDHGFGYLRLESADGRILVTESAFITAPPTKTSILDRQKAFRDLLALFGLGN